MMFAVILYANMRGSRSVDRIVELCQYKPGNAHMFVIEGMDKVRETIEKSRNRKLTKYKKLSNNCH